jgi:type IV pilus assembly protein PilM
MAFLGFGGKSLLGVDIGASAIKIIKGKISGAKFQVDELSTTPLTFGAISDRGIDDQALVLTTIKNSLGPFGKASHLVSTAVKGAGVLTKRIVMPKVPQKEIAQQVKWEAEQVFPTDISNILISFLLLGEGTDVPMAPPGTKGWDILLVGVQREEAELYRSLFQQAQSKIHVMDLDAFASADLLAELIELPKAEAIAFVDIGATGTRVIVNGSSKRRSRAL